MIVHTLANLASVAKRSVALLLAAALVAGVTPAGAEPGDIFSVAVPVAGTSPEAAKPIAHGDVSVARQTGALQYAYPISVPPGRNGAQPHLSLAYSSQASIYGGIAAGWTLSGVPVITEDTSRGRTWEQLHGKRFTSSLSAGRPLVQVNEPTAAGTTAYRAQNDSSFVRYQKGGGDRAGNWQAFATDGTVYYFGETDSHRGTCTTFSESYAPLTHTTDSFGNVVDYFYSAGVDGECALTSISWGANANASVAHFATATFNYSFRGQTDCPYGSFPGAATSYRTGTKIVTGAATLANVTVTAYPPGQPSTPDHTRVITLNYTADSQSCSSEHSPYRELSSIQESAWGTDSPRVDLPAVRFTYGNSDFGVGTLRYSGSAPTTNPWQGAIVVRPTDTFNLGWGYRFTDGTWPSVEAMMVDVDGDGLVDRVVDASLGSDGHVTSCRAKWFRNQGPGRSFISMGYIQLPTLKWASVTSFAGGRWARDNTAGGARERCSLNFQITGYVNSFNSGGDLLCRGQNGATYACPNGSGASGYCDHSTADAMYGDDCSAKIFNPTARYTYLAYRWVDFDGDGKVDLVASPAQGGFTFYNLQAGNANGAPIEPALFGKWPACPTPSGYTAYPNDPYKPYTMCGGMFPWFVYKNKGNGVFGAQQSGQLVPDEIHYQPIPLETTSGDSSVTSNPVGQYQGWFDIDGDGHSDAVTADPLEQSNFWMVFINDGTGQFVPAAPYTPFKFTTPFGADVTLNDCLTSGACSAVGVQGLIDMNGDGLVDEWSSVPNGTYGGVALNDGLGFRVVNGGGELLVNRPATDGTTVADDVATGTSPFVRAGMRGDYRRTLDVDLDGRPDLITPSSTNTPDTHFNIGIDFGAGMGNLGDGFAMNHMIVVAESNCVGTFCQGQIPDYMQSAGTTYTWELRSDMIDLDGDSVPEGVNFGAEYSSSQLLQSHVDPMVDAQPPRLLVGIDNQRGATSSIAYAPLAGSQTVQQEPGLGKASPRTSWVVASITDSDSVSATALTTTYSYKDPHWSPDDEGRWGFRGFDQVTVTAGPNGASTIEKYSYSPDWSGRLATALVQPAPSETTISGEIRSIDDTSWEARTLFGGAVTTYHPIKHDHWTCANGQTESACRSATGNHTATVSTWTQLKSDTTSDPTQLLWVETDVRSMLGTTFADGDRTHSTRYRLASDPSTYRLRKIDEQSYVQIAGAETSYAHHVHGWDATLRFLQTDITYPDAATKAVTEYTYDTTTGNVVTRRKPQQYATSGPVLRYTYDARKLFVATQVDELHDALTYTYEYGTGTKLETQGPNTASCVATANCPAGTVPKQDHRIRIDGIGRTIETWEAFGDSGSNYFPYEVAIDTYDMAIPNGVTRQQAISLSGYTVNYAKSRTDYDGHGRQVRSTLYASGAAAADKVTTFHYSNQGPIASIDVPDPSTNDASIVTYHYTADSLGRITSFRRPDNTTPASQSGVDVAFNGLQQTTTEVAGAAGGQAAVTTLFHDAFNRVTEVDETAQSSPLQVATTHYTYAPDDNVATIVDPEGVTTVLKHDFDGNRIAVTRGTRTWSYTYDLNGNMTAETQPCSPQPTCSADYTTSTVYDALDRPTSRLLAHGPLSANPTDVDYFGADHEVFTWDGTQANAKGTLVDWATYGTAGPQVVETAMTHDAQGHVLADISTFAGAGLNAQRTLTDAYNLGGDLATVNYGDTIGTTAASSATMSYDARGLMSQIQVARQVGTAITRTTINYSRNVDALVTNVRKYSPTIAQLYIDSNWSYDKLGRVTKQQVQKDYTHTLLAEQDLAYFGTDDPQSLDHWLGASNHKHFAYTYDARHQLTGVSETAYPNAFAATYTYGLAGRFTTANENAASLPGGQVKPRNVVYHYAGTDPEEVTSLTQSGTNFATYTYDLDGNQTSRTYPATGETWNFTYDGKNQLRRVVKLLNNVPQGTEEYWYDGDGARAAIVKRDSVGTKSELITFLRDVESHYDGTGLLKFIYAYVQRGAPIGRITHSASAPTTFELEFHGLGNSTLATVTGDSGIETVNASFDYTPFGEVLESTNAGGTTAGVAAHPRQFNDKYADDLSSLDYYGIRYYDEILMQWTQGDPAYRFAPDAARRQPRRANLYVSDLNNPVRYSDPDGRDSTTCKEDGKCTTSTTPSDDADASAATVDSPPPDEQPAGEMKFSEEVGLLIVVGAICEPCAAVLAGGMAASGNSDGEALTGALIGAGVGGEPGGSTKAGADTTGDTLGGGATAKGTQPSGARFEVTPSGVAIPTDPKEVMSNLGQMKDVSTNPGSSRKFTGTDSQGPVRVRVEKAHPADPNFKGRPDPLHTVDHMHIDRRSNGATGAWSSKEKISYKWPF